VSKLFTERGAGFKSPDVLAFSLMLIPEGAAP
jgi:hypothetical protein